MTASFDVARNLLLEPGGLTEKELESTLGMMLTHSIDSADLYFQISRHESWSLEEGIVKDGRYGLDRGVGVRAMSGEKTGFAYADEISLATLTDAAASARSIAKAGQSGRVKTLHSSTINSLYPALDPIGALSAEDKVQLLQALDAEARKMDPRVSQVMVSLSGVQDVILLAASDGTFAADIRPLVRLSISVVVEQNGRRETGSSGGGGRHDYGFFVTAEQGLSYAREAVRMALVNLDAKPAPAGMMDVVLGSGWPGILLHEAIGHGLEGDFNRKGTSAFSGRLGERVATEQCTVVDDGTLKDKRGSLTVDDEGVASQNTMLIEKGILKGYMHDKLNAKLMGVASTGNGRRESYAHLPMPRMTNTYMQPGKYDPQEIIASIDHGLFAVNFGGGQVDITSGKFVFSASEAYMVEKGKITYPVRGATLIGNGPDVLTRVSMVGNDLALDPGVGTCGKDGQSVPVCVGQPTLRVNQLTIGGTGT
ncbi:TldD protein, part of TldE/TldD proteolytic complex [hydrothermal vent metagenome]|uniref:TldD protein, part of TldE/TldD proteolytic complex n=1 Tax=hydrothermal vent metagenome TaxID=652676 RepID=A0A3B0ZKL6_9ZZZZ